MNPMNTTNGIPDDVLHILTCNWVDANGNWSCFANDGFTWRPRNIVLLNALPLNAFNSRVRVDIVPVDTSVLLNTLKDLPMHNYKCFIGHPPTSLLLKKYIPVDCTRGMYTYHSHDDLIIAFVLKTRPSATGADVNVTLDDLLSYVIVPSPIL